MRLVEDGIFNGWHRRGKFKIQNIVVLIILFAALLHASWNFVLRGSQDKFLSMSAIALGHMPLGVLGLIFFGFPNWQSVIYVLTSSFLHFFYQLFLLNAYKHGELSQVYPVSRGISPLLIVLVITFFLGENFSRYELMGITCISISLILYGIKIGLGSRLELKGFVFAICTGLFIASYSLVDGYGVQVAQNAVGFYSAVTILNGLMFALFLICFSRETFQNLVRNGQKIFWIGGSASFAAYVLVVWACLYLPIPVVYTLRETSVFFAVLLATMFLKEKLTIYKIFLLFTLCIGVILIKLSL